MRKITNLFPLLSVRTVPCRKAWSATSSFLLLCWSEFFTTEVPIAHKACSKHLNSHEQLSASTVCCGGWHLGSTRLQHSCTFCPTPRSRAANRLRARGDINSAINSDNNIIACIQVEAEEASAVAGRSAVVGEKGRWWKMWKRGERRWRYKLVGHFLLPHHHLSCHVNYLHTESFLIHRTDKNEVMVAYMYLSATSVLVRFFSCK